MCKSISEGLYNEHKDIKKCAANARAGKECPKFHHQSQLTQGADTARLGGQCSEQCSAMLPSSSSHPPLSLTHLNKVVHEQSVGEQLAMGCDQSACSERHTLVHCHICMHKAPEVLVATQHMNPPDSTNAGGQQGHIQKLGLKKFVQVICG